MNRANYPLARFLSLLIALVSLNNEGAWASAPEAQTEVVLTTRWAPREGRSLVVKARTLVGDERGSAELLIFDGNKQLFSTIAFDEPYSAFCTSGPTPRLVTVWLSGNGAYHVRVFALRADKIVQVLDAGSKLFPEFAYPAAIPAEASQQITIPKGEWRVDRGTSQASLVPSGADIYSWNGKEYVLRKDVPWAKRFGTP